MTKRNVELLAPAGSYESMTAAVNAGADAVYIGGSRFGARAYADNLDEETMVRAIDYIHLHGRRIYMTVNTLVKERELSELPDFLRPFYEAGLDAVLVQDLGVFSCVRTHFPDLPLHISTQMTVTGKYSASDLKRLGAVRVVPARELSIAELKSLAESTGLEVETFVHGALCYCYSGQCLFSSLIGGRSGNRGRCAQTCRLPFDVLRREGRLNKKDEKYVLSLKDLCTLELLPDILEAGVCSLKIEGRMKSPRYTAGVVSIYRKYVDRFLRYGREGYAVEEGDKRALLSLFDRGGQTNGYYKQENGRNMVVLKEKPAFREEDEALYEYLDRTYVNQVCREKIGGTAYFEVGKPARLTAEFPLKGSFGEKELQRFAAAAASLLIWKEGDVVEEAKNAPMDETGIRRQLMKTADSPFIFERLEITVKGRAFVPVSVLNRMRRELLEELEREVLALFHRTYREMPKPCDRVFQERTRSDDGMVPGGKFSEGRAVLQQDRLSACLGGEPELCVLVSGAEQFEAVFGRLKAWKAFRPSGRFGVYLASEEFDASSWEGLAGRCHEAGIFCYLMLPRIFRERAERYFLKNMDTLKAAGFDAFGVASMEEPGFLREQALKLPLYFDHSLYAMNHLAAGELFAYGASRLTFPVELNERELSECGFSGELIVYGRLPMMVSAQCVQKTLAGCKREPGHLMLKDRKGKLLPVKNQCRFCYNTIYNESPLSLLGLSEPVKRLAPQAVRLNFTLETGEAAADVLAAFYQEFFEGGAVTAPSGAFTRGHFKRGVQ